MDSASSLVSKLRGFGISLGIQGLEGPVGIKHLENILGSRQRLAKRGRKTRKPSHVDRAERVARQKKARPIV